MPAPAVSASQLEIAASGPKSWVNPNRCRQEPAAFPEKAPPSQAIADGLHGQAKAGLNLNAPAPEMYTLSSRPQQSLAPCARACLPIGNMICVVQSYWYAVRMAKAG